MSNCYQINEDKKIKYLKKIKSICNKIKEFKIYYDFYSSKNSLL